MKNIVKIILIIVLLTLGTGLVLQYKGHPMAEKIIGISVLLIVFVLLPFFLYYRYKDKNLNDYVLDKDKWEKIKDNFKKNM